MAWVDQGQLEGEDNIISLLTPDRTRARLNNSDMESLAQEAPRDLEPKPWVDARWRGSWRAPRRRRRGRTPQRFYVLFDRSEDHWKLTVYDARASTAYLWDSGIPDHKDPNRARDAQGGGADPVL